MPLSRAQKELILSADPEALDLRIAEKARKRQPLTERERVYLQSTLMPAGGPGAGLPQYASKSVLADALGISRQLLQHHTRNPAFPTPNKAGNFRTADVLEYARTAGLGVTKSHQPAPNGTNGHDVVPDLHVERALLARAQRIGVEMENRRKSGELVELVVVEQAWDAIRTDARQFILGLPTTLESQCNLPPADAKRVFGLAQRLVDDILTNLAKPPNYNLTDQAPDEADE